jgi:hypothetical protein
MNARAAEEAARLPPRQNATTAFLSIGTRHASTLLITYPTGYIQCSSPGAASKSMYSGGEMNP